jgi:hypothetical protein
VWWEKKNSDEERRLGWDTIVGKKRGRAESKKDSELTSSSFSGKLASARKKRAWPACLSRPILALCHYGVLPAHPPPSRLAERATSKPKGTPTHAARRVSPMDILMQYQQTSDREDTHVESWPSSN